MKNDVSEKNGHSIFVNNPLFNFFIQCSSFNKNCRSASNCIWSASNFICEVLALDLTSVENWCHYVLSFLMQLYIIREFKVVYCFIFIFCGFKGPDEIAISHTPPPHPLYGLLIYFYRVNLQCLVIITLTDIYCIVLSY